MGQPEQGIQDRCSKSISSCGFQRPAQTVVVPPKARTRDVGSIGRWIVEKSDKLLLRSSGEKLPLSRIATLTLVRFNSNPKIIPAAPAPITQISVLILVCPDNLLALINIELNMFVF